MDANYLKHTIGPVLSAAISALASHTNVVEHQVPYKQSISSITANRPSTVENNRESVAGKRSSVSSAAAAAAAATSNSHSSTRPVGYIQQEVIELPDPVSFVARYLIHHDTLGPILEEDRQRSNKIRGMYGTFLARERSFQDAKKRVLNDIKTRGQEMEAGLEESAVPRIGGARRMTRKDNSTVAEAEVASTGVTETTAAAEVPTQKQEEVLAADERENSEGIVSGESVPPIDLPVSVEQPADDKAETLKPDEEATPAVDAGSSEIELPAPTEPEEKEEED